MHNPYMVDDMHTTNEEVAAKVRKALNAEGYAPKDIAIKLNISRSQVSRLLSGKSQIKFEHLVTIGEFLRINPRALLGLDPTDDGTFISVRTAAELANRHPETIRKNIALGRLRSSQSIRNGSHNIRLADFRAWMAGAR